MSQQGRLTIEFGATPSASEIRTAQLLVDRGHDVVVRRPTGRRSPAGATADLLVNGVAYDIYCPRTANLARIVSAVASKGSQAYGVILDLTETTATGAQLHDVFQRVQRTGSRLQDVIIIGG